MEQPKSPSLAPTAFEVAGASAERAFIHSLKDAGGEPYQNELFDRGKHQVDALILQHEGVALARPVEIQVTLQLDNVQKMSHFLRGKPFAAGAVRLYVEAWSPHVMPAAARHVHALLTRWRTNPAPPWPLFLRVGRDGRWIGDFLHRRVRDLCLQLCHDHPERQYGTVVDFQGNNTVIKTVEGKQVWIPVRLMETETRLILRDALDAGTVPLRAVTFLPGHKDRSGIPVFLAKFTHQSAGEDARARRISADREKQRRASRAFVALRARQPQETFRITQGIASLERKIANLTKALNGTRLDRRQPLQLQLNEKQRQLRTLRTRLAALKSVPTPTSN